MRGRCIRKAVVLAAGRGTRMQPLTGVRPKVLLPVWGQPLILYPLLALVEAGIHEVAVVLGHGADVVRGALAEMAMPSLKVTYAANPWYRGGNALSVYAAHEWLEGDPFVLCMGDHLVAPELVSRLVDCARDQDTLCVDRAPGPHTDVDEATKVAVNRSGLVTDIGKGLRRWDALDTGVFLLTRRFLEMVERLLPTAGVELDISRVVRAIIDGGGRVASCDVSGLFWADIDCPEDLYALPVGRELWGTGTTG